MPPARAPRKPAPDRRREIVDAALRVIASQGLGRFTSLAIAQEVGLSDGALFRHFASKDAIVAAAIDRVEELLFDGFPPAADDPIDRLGAFFRRRVEVIRAHPGISTLVATEELAKAGARDGVERVAAFRRRSTDFVRSCLAEAGQRRLLAPGLGAEEGLVIVLGALLALAHATTAPSRETISAIAPRVWKALEMLLRGRPHPPETRARRSARGRRSSPDPRGEPR